MNLGVGLNTSWTKWTFMLLCVLIAIYASLWSWKATSLTVFNHQRTGTLAYTNLSREMALFSAHPPTDEALTRLFETGLPPLDNKVVTEIRKKVANVMKPWQIIQIFRQDVDPRNMQFLEDLTEIQKQSESESIERRVTSCAVVGNSGILLGSDCGHIIDNMDIIIRMNLAEFGHEYSSDVGSKVTFMTINKSQMKEMLSCFLKMAKHTLRNATVSTQCDLLIKRLRMLNSNVLWLFKGQFPGLLDVLSYLKKRFSLSLRFAYSPLNPVSPSRRLWKFRSLASTGLAMYTASTQLCDEISLFGFYPFYTDIYNRTILYHYYEPEVKMNYTTNRHTMPEEHKLYLDLEKKRAIRLLNNCTLREK